MSTPDELFENLRAAKVRLAEAEQTVNRIELELEQANEWLVEARRNTRRAGDAIDKAASPAQAG